MRKPPEDIAVKLLAASEKMPTGSGFDASIDEVAKWSGIPRATLYYYFSGKEDLVEFYLNDLIDRSRVAIEKAAAMEGSYEERLTSIMRAVVTTFAEYPRMCIEMASAFKASEDHAEFLGNIDQSIMIPLRGVLADGAISGELELTDVAVAAIAIMGALHQVSMTKLIMTGKLDVDEVERTLFPQLLRGLISA